MRNRSRRRDKTASGSGLARETCARGVSRKQQSTAPSFHVRTVTYLDPAIVTHVTSLSPAVCLSHVTLGFPPRLPSSAYRGGYKKKSQN